MSFIQNQFERNFITTSVDYVFNWARKSAIWPMTFGLACCAIEMIASSTSRFDIARFGAEVFRPSPRQSDLMIVAGTVTLKMAPVLKRIYDQMPDPKWVISMGACSSVGGPFNTQRVAGRRQDRAGGRLCHRLPPRPENLFYALLKLRDKIDQMTTLVKRPTEVRLDESMLEDFKRRVMIARVRTRSSRRAARSADRMFYKDEQNIYRARPLEHLTGWFTVSDALVGRFRQMPKSGDPAPDSFLHCRRCGRPFRLPGGGRRAG
jgi:NADH-quinone oxidoreductase subunit B